MCRAALAWLVVLCGCDLVLGLDSRLPDAGPAPEWIVVAAGTAHTCAISVDRTLWCWGENGRGQAGLPVVSAEITSPTQVGDARWVTVTSGHDHTCAIDSDAGLWCWGANIQNSIGANSPADHLPLTRVLDEVTAVAAGSAHTCAIRADKTLWCWGRSIDGQVAHPYPTPPLIHEPAPKQVMGDLRWTKLAAGLWFTCGITTSEALLCWGMNRNGQVLVGGEAQYNEPQLIEPDTRWVDVSVGHQHTCAVRADGTMRCQGFNSRGQTATAPNNSGGDVSTGEPARTWTRVFAAVDHTCALRDDQSLWCFGDNGQSAFALETPDTLAAPKRISGGGEQWVSVATGARHLCGIDVAGVLWCAGTDGAGQLGSGTGGGKLVPTQVTGTWNTVAVGSRSVCARDLDGAVFCWGDNGSGQLGDASTVAKQRPQFVVAGIPDGALAVGSAHACARTEAPSARLSCWGDNFAGQLGVGTTTTALSPQPTPMLDPGPLAAANHTCTLSQGPNLFCWGSNSEGQLGFMKDIVPHASPLPINATWSDLAAGWAHTCGVRTSPPGDLECWGDDRRGQRGNDIDVGPGPVLAGVKSVEAGGEHTCAITTSDLLRCWGANTEGQVGNDALADRTTPVPIGVASWAAVALGARHTCGLQFAGPSGNSLWCWGDNSRGQLGNGTRIGATVPTRIGTELWNRIAAGGNETCATKLDGSLWCWGANGSGQIGDESAWTPVFVRIAP